MLTLGVLAGDGIGPEIVASATQIAERALGSLSIGVQWRALPFGLTAIGEIGHRCRHRLSPNSTGCPGGS
mgnify:CR=1 FL=1